MRQKFICHSLLLFYCIWVYGVCVCISETLFQMPNSDVINLRRFSSVSHEGNFHLPDMFYEGVTFGLTTSNSHSLPVRLSLSISLTHTHTHTLTHCFYLFFKLFLFDFVFLFRVYNVVLVFVFFVFHLFCLKFILLLCFVLFMSSTFLSSLDRKIFSSMNW